MIVEVGKKGNLGVLCDADGCVRRFDGIIPTEVKTYRKGGIVDANIYPDWKASPESVRRQAKRRDWQVVIDKRGSDLCPDHVGKDVVGKTRT